MDDVDILYMVDNYDDRMVRKIVLHVARLECETYGDS